MTQTKHANVWAALVAARTAMPRLTKSEDVKDNKGKVKYSYSGIDAVLDVVMPSLAAVGIWMETYVMDTEPSVIQYAVRFHHETGPTEPMPGPRVPVGGGFMTDQQQAGNAATYARRYCILGALNLAAEDDDGEIASQPPQQDKATSATTPPPPNGAERLSATTRDSDTVRKQLHATVTAIFNGLDVDDARHWLIDKWSRKNTPDNIRASATNLTADEMQSIINDIKPAKAAAALRKVYMEEHPFEEGAENG